MSEVDSQFVHRGVWTNTDKGPILGRTITANAQTGNFLVALLAVLSTVGTAHAWQLTMFWIHQTRADGRPHDALFRQQQALLRTLPASNNVLTDTLKLWWSWKGKARRPFLRSIIIILLAFMFTSATLAASIFSSFIVSTGDLVVLIDSPFCGWVRPERLQTRAYADPVFATATPYADNCYSNGTGKLSRVCDVFLQPNITFNVQQVSCPFDSMCQSDVAVSLDSALLDVNQAFGMNLPSKNRVQYRKKTTCGVLPTDGHYDGQKPSLDDLGQEFIADNEPTEFISVKYGQSGNNKGNTTVIFGSAFSNVSQGYIEGKYIDYTSPLPPFFSTLNAIPELKREDGDTQVTVTTFNGMRYGQRVEDPLFRATGRREQTVVFGNGTKAEGVVTFVAAAPFGAVACLQQYQFCYARKSGGQFCTSLIGLPADVSQQMFLEANELQLSVLRLLVTSSYMFDMTNDATKLALSLADDSRVIPGLPPDQWIKELVWAESTAYAMLQVGFTDYAIGPKVRDSKAEDWVKPVTNGEKELCHMQRMRKSGNFVNINVFGLAFVIAVSCLIMIINITLLRFLVFLSRFRRALAPRIDRWIQDGVWQLQRQAYQAQGHRHWIDVEKEIPLILGEGDQLKDLPVLWVPPKLEGVDTFMTTPSTSGTSTPLRKDTKIRVGIKEQPTAASTWSARVVRTFFWEKRKV